MSTAGANHTERRKKAKLRKILCEEVRPGTQDRYGGVSKMIRATIDQDQSLACVQVRGDFAGELLAARCLHRQKSPLAPPFDSTQGMLFQRGVMLQNREELRLQKGDEGEFWTPSRTMRESITEAHC